MTVWYFGGFNSLAPMTAIRRVLDLWLSRFPLISFSTVPWLTVGDCFVVSTVMKLWDLWRSLQPSRLHNNFNGLQEFLSTSLLVIENFQGVSIKYSHFDWRQRRTATGMLLELQAFLYSLSPVGQHPLITEPVLPQLELMWLTERCRFVFFVSLWR